MPSDESSNTAPHSEREGAPVEKKPVNYDDILECLGQFGKFQLRFFLWLGAAALFPGAVILSYTFTGGVPNYRCYIKGCDDEQRLGEFVPSWLNNAIPWENTNQSLRQCYRYNRSWSELPRRCARNGERRLTPCNEWMYDTSVFKSTIVSDFNLTCSDEWKQTLVSSVFMFGMLVGAVFVGNVGDRIGRRYTFTLNAFVLACVVTGSAFSPNLEIFCVLRFFSGVGACGHFLILFVWGIEATGERYRLVCGFVYQMIFSVGSLMLGAIAYFVRNWRILQIIIGVPIFALVPYFWILPESTRWLISKKRYPEARANVAAAAKLNNKVIPEHLLIEPTESLSEVCEKVCLKTGTAAQLALTLETIVEVLRSGVLARRIFIMFSAWYVEFPQGYKVCDQARKRCIAREISGSFRTAVVTSYYGFTYSAANLSGNLYVNYELTILVEFPAYIAGVFLLDKFGRRNTLCGCLLLSGIASLVAGVIPQDLAALKSVSSSIGKLFISCALATVYAFTSELFSTSTRSTVMGLCSTSGRIGGILAPILIDGGKRVHAGVPYILFASVNIAVGTLCLALPETNRKPLPTTIQDAIELEKCVLLRTKRRVEK